MAFLALIVFPWQVAWHSHTPGADCSPPTPRTQAQSARSTPGAGGDSGSRGDGPLRRHSMGQNPEGTPARLARVSLLLGTGHILLRTAGQLSLLHPRLRVITALDACRYNTARPNPGAEDGRGSLPHRVSVPCSQLLEAKVPWGRDGTGESCSSLKPSRPHRRWEEVTFSVTVTNASAQRPSPSTCPRTTGFIRRRT